MSGTQGPRFAPGEMERRLPGFCIWMVHGWFLEICWFKCDESWFCLKLTSLKMGHVSVVEFEVLAFIVEATDRLEVRFLRESP